MPYEISIFTVCNAMNRIEHNKKVPITTISAHYLCIQDLFQLLRQLKYYTGLKTEIVTKYRSGNVVTEFADERRLKYVQLCA